MCGIAGYAGDFVVGLVARMNAAQAHHGPDDTGAFEDAAAGVTLGHVRLSVLDLSPTAAQPMYSPDIKLRLGSVGCVVHIHNHTTQRRFVQGSNRRFHLSKFKQSKLEWIEKADAALASARSELVAGRQDFSANRVYAVRAGDAIPIPFEEWVEVMRVNFEVADTGAV